MAEWYGTAAAADAYFTARQVTTWTGVQAVKEAALLVASVWIDARYSGMFPGIRATGLSQLREWPRSGAVDIYGYGINVATVPLQVENATYEAALRHMIEPGALSVDFVAGSAIKSLSVDGALSIDFAGATSMQDMQVQIPVINQILYPILNKNAATNGGVSGLSVRG